MHVVLNDQPKATLSFSDGDSMTCHHYSNLFTHPPQTLTRQWRSYYIDLGNMQRLQRLAENGRKDVKFTLQQAVKSQKGNSG
jgi:hypothetical protein